MRTANEVTYSNLINGELQAAMHTIDSIDPATGKVWAKIPSSTVEDVDAAVAAARAAFPSWSGLTGEERAHYLRAVGDKLTEYAEELAALETQDNGWVIRETSYGLIPVLKRLWYDAAGAAANANRGETIPMGDTSFGYTVREPFGVIAGILPWNAPLFTFTLKAAYALAAGNTIILKPSEQASVSSLRYSEILKDLLPAGTLNTVSGLGSEIGDALVQHPGVDKVSLTGSGRTATAIIQATSTKPKPITLELGGKSPNIIFADANLDKAVEAIASYIIYTGNAGQICVGGSRILVERPVYEEVIERLTEVMSRSVLLGNTLHPETTMGPIANAPQYEKVRAYIELGKKEGELVFGGRYGGIELFPEGSPYEGGYWIEPTLFKVNSNSLRICQEEVFGPVATIMPFQTEEEAVAIANDTNYGLAAGVWTNDLSTAQRMVRRLHAGNVWVNTYGRVGPELPFGGMKDSGYGTDSILEFTREKSCVIEIEA
ncbi:MAG: aldehyde dehydrogenase family protein [Bacillus sp. (in: firmicutes)]